MESLYTAQYNRFESRAIIEAMSGNAAHKSPVFSRRLQALVELHLSVCAMKLAPPAPRVPLCQARWFNDVIEVSGILESLIDRTVPMPESFLLAEDTFLRLLLAEEARIVETEHPYTVPSGPQFGTVYVPNASKLQVRFHPDWYVPCPIPWLFRK